DQEAGGVLDQDGRLAQLASEGEDRVHRRRIAPLGGDDLHQRHAAHGVEEVHAHHPAALRRPGADAGDGERRGVEGEDRVGPPVPSTAVWRTGRGSAPGRPVSFFAFSVRWKTWTRCFEIFEVASSAAARASASKPALTPCSTPTRTTSRARRGAG